MPATSSLPFGNASSMSSTAPVTDIGDAPTQQLRTRPALCLSGGGYRAMLFHLGSLWRLNELGYLPKLDRISSVSGGSITAARLARYGALRSASIRRGRAEAPPRAQSFRSPI